MATKVTDILQQLLTSQLKNEKLGADRVVKILEEVRRQVAQELITLPADGFSAWRMNQTLASINTHLATWRTDSAREVTGVLKSAWDAGTELLPAMSEAAGIRLTTFGISTHQLEALTQFTLDRFANVTADLTAKIRGEVILGTLGQKSPYEVAAAITGNLAELPKDEQLPRFKSGRTIFADIEARAETITKLEMGRINSMAHQASMAAAADTLPEMEKMWLHTGHPKIPRPSHQALHGVVKPVEENFLSGSIAMMYPRDPKAPISEVIGCGCMHVAYMKAWGTKKEFIASWEKAQDKAYKPMKQT